MGDLSHLIVWKASLGALLNEVPSSTGYCVSSSL